MPVKPGHPSHPRGSSCETSTSCVEALLPLRGHLAMCPLQWLLSFCSCVRLCDPAEASGGVLTVEALRGAGCEGSGGSPDGVEKQTSVLRSQTTSGMTTGPPRGCVKEDALVPPHPRVFRMEVLHEGEEAASTCAYSNSGFSRSQKEFCVTEMRQTNPEALPWLYTVPDVKLNLKTGGWHAATPGLRKQRQEDPESETSL